MRVMGSIMHAVCISVCVGVCVSLCDVCVACFLAYMFLFDIQLSSSSHNVERHRPHRDDFSQTNRC